MNQIFWGLLSALSLGTADFLAGLSARSLGFARVLFWVFVVSSICLTSYMVLVGQPMVIVLSDQWLIVVFGLLNTVAMLLLYAALAIGPLSLVAPIIAAYPVIVVAFAFLLGSRPSVLQWLGMGLAMIGVVIVAAAVRGAVVGSANRSKYKKAITLALCASMAYAALVISGQQAVPIHGELQTLWLGRVIAMVTLIPVLLVSKISPAAPIRWWPVLCLLGVLDFGGLLFLFLGSRGDFAEITAVIGSLFGAVTVLLARIFLKEQMSMFQWMGIILIFFGVGCLSAAA
ncbi:MAG: EamA family transporter [Planctomycetota bacterium]|jgi:drug/metabolite transporter (DMT)-like permease